MTCHEARSLKRPRPDRQINRQVIEIADIITDDQIEADLGVGAQQTVQDRRQDMIAIGGTGGDAHCTSGPATARLMLGRIERLENGLPLACKAIAFFGYLNFSSGAFQERHAQPLLKPSHHLGNRRRRHPTRPGGGRKTAFRDDAQ